VLTADNIHKSYKNPVLDGVSISVRPGEIVGVAGVNGCGKSTLLAIMTSVVRPDMGAVTCMGGDVFKEPGLLRKYVGYVPQKNGLFENLSARDNLLFWASAYRVKPRLERFDGQFLSKKAGRLSEGMKKRLSIAIAMQNDPLFLVMDEPTAALDIGFKREFLLSLGKVKEEGRAVLFSSHQPDELAVCDRLFVMSGGKFAFEGPPEELAAREGMEFGEALLDMISEEGKS